MPALKVLSHHLQLQALQEDDFFIEENRIVHEDLVGGDIEDILEEEE
jgi:hypothetical protein